MKGLANRRFFVYYFIVLVSAVLIGRVAYLQLISEKFKEQAQKVTLERQLIYPSRGLLYDRNGKTLVFNKPIYVIYATYRKIDPKMDTTLFCSLLGIDKEIFNNNLNKDWRSPQFHKSIPFVFLTKVSPEQFAIFQEHMYKFPGFTAVERSIRGYPHSHGGHLLGYLGEVDQKIIDHSDGAYISGDYIGKSGLELSYERELSGVKGIKYILKDNLGRRIGPYDNGRLDSLALSGEDIQISIDLELQAYADSLMMNKRGALVAIEPTTGEILAMVSAPTYDPNLLVLDENRSSGMLQLLRDTINRPLNNRAVTNKFPPGSIFKPIISLIALQKGVTTIQRPISCFGGFRLSATKKMGCHGHAPIRNISEAIQHSCNTYYLQITKDFLDQYGTKNPGLGLDTLVSYLNDFGLGTKLGIDFSYEGQGFIPDSKFYNRVYQKETSGWKSMWVLSLGIGQGEVQLTTIQMANLAVILANRGYYITPHFIRNYLSGKSKPESFRMKKKMRIDDKYFPPVINGMEAVVTSGTASSAYVPGLDICGKTGTSQNPHGKDHSVFFGFAPKNNPKIAVAVFIENAGWGGSWAAPISSLLIEMYLNKKIDPSRKSIELKMMNGLIETDSGAIITQNNTFQE